MKNNKTAILFVVAAIGLVIMPLVLQTFGNSWVRILDTALLYVLLAVGLNIVVGYAGLLDLGYVAFFAVGAYLFGLLNSPHLTDTFPAIAALFPHGLHTPLWITIPLAAGVAGLFGILLGALMMAGTSIWLGGRDVEFSGLSVADSRRALLVLITLTIHSFPEGIAIGVAFGS